MLSGNKKPHVLTQTNKVCLSAYELLLPPGIKGLSKQLVKKIEAIFPLFNYESVTLENLQRKINVSGAVAWRYVCKSCS